MADMFLATRRIPWSLYAAANLTTNIAIGSTPLADVDIATYNVPTGAQDCGFVNRSLVTTFLEFMPFAVGTAAQTLDLQVRGWVKDPTLARWVPRCLGRVTATLSAVVLTGTTNKTCNTIAITEGTDGTDITQQTNALGFATFMVDMKGSDYFTIVGNRGSATSFNMFYKGI